MSLYDWWTENDTPTETRRPPVKVGWVLRPNKGAIVYYAPERLKSPDVSREHAKSASRCPAVINLESRYFMIRCPFDLHLRLVRDKDGKPALQNMAGDKSPMRGNKIREHVHMTPQHEWRYPDRPTIQITTPYVLLCDEPVYLSQLPPFLDYLRDPWPGTLFGGRFPIHVWPRTLMWAMEWSDPKKDLILHRGDPWFYLGFETYPPDRALQVVEGELTPEAEDYIDHIAGAVNYVNQTFSLFKTAEERRPEKIFKAKER